MVHLGAPGLFVVSFLDAFVIPLPLPGSADLLILLLTAQGGNPWLMAGLAIAGTVSGGYISWSVGKRGGEPMLEKLVRRRILNRVKRWTESRGATAVFVATILPPPVPLTPFLIASGALAVPRHRFLLAFAGARTLRYGLMAWLGVHYGHVIVHAWTTYLSRYSTPILGIFLALVVGTSIYGGWKYRQLTREPAPA